jgi:predicted dehydrogenase
LLLSGQKKASPNEKFVVAAMGLRARGRAVLGLFASIPEVEIAALCDVDANQFPAALEIIAKHQRKAPRTETDFRRVIEDKTIDILLVTTPDHWHAIPAILACQNGKHVYVEKPISHNLAEGQAMVRAARRYRRVVQVGVQSRSSRHVAEACEHIRTGGIGRVFFARGWESSRQNSVGRPADENPPPGVDYDLWLGPAPLRPFNRNRFHGTWRWFFDYGTGDLGNDGVHRIDYARRGLEAGFAFAGKSLPEWPESVVASGGKHFFDDAQEWPDNLVATWEYPGALLTYEMRVWSKPVFEGEKEGAAIYGEDGTVIIGNESWRALDAKGQVIRRGEQSIAEYDDAHNRNFLQCIRDNSTPAGDIGLGHVMSGMIHMGNISWRVKRKLRFDAERQAFSGDAEANALISREYREPWVLPRV